MDGVSADLSGYEGKDRVSGATRSAKEFVDSFEIEGKAAKLNFTDPTIWDLVYLTPNPNLDYLGKAVSSLFEGRIVESIKDSFKVIEGNKSLPDYYKYACM